MRQEDDRAMGEQPGKSIVEKCLGVVIQRCRWFLDNQQGWIAEDGPGQGNAELFADSEGVPQFADGGLVAVRQLLNEMMGMGHLGGLDNLRQRVTGIAAADVVGDRIVEDKVVLQDDGDLGTQ